MSPLPVAATQGFVVQDKWFDDESQVLHPFLGLGVCKSKLEWDAMEVSPAGEGKQVQKRRKEKVLTSEPL